ncbi:MAG TPA: hypothetical protein VJQ79_13895, partial [Acidimicrobiia bacterium]|nr:hypothetical protein [Acidimicrobiia bacterium]
MSEGALNGFQDALTRALEGETVLVLVDSPVGSAESLVGLIPESLPIRGRVACAPVCSALVGGVAEDLGLDQFNGGALVVEDAQWADPTSLGRLQRMVKDGISPLLLVVAHRTLREEDAWWLGQLADTARRNGHLSEVTLPAPDSQIDTSGLDAKALELAIASRLVTGTLSVSLAADFLDMSEEQVLSVGDDLVARGLLRQARGGYLPSPDLPADFAGEARIGFVAGRLAEALRRSGGPPSMVGALLAAGGRPADAFPVLAGAAAEAEERHATGEAYHLATAALTEAQEAGIVDRHQLGRLHLTAGKFLRAAGRTSWAADHLERASASLEGSEKVDALRFAAAVADDAQHPQDAERIAAMAEQEAASSGDVSEWGSILIFRARALNRIGFAAEADAALVKGDGLLQAGGSSEQRFQALQSRAWIHFDRGEAALAEAAFTRLRDESERQEDDVSLADKEAWRARSLFPAGRPDEALRAVEVVNRVSALEDIEAPLFLAQLALTEGGLAYGRYQEAL